MKKLISIAASVALIAGCSTYRPIVDTQGVDPAAYERDLSDCQRYAEGIEPVQNVAAGAAIGAGIAVFIGAALGLRGRDLQQLATGHAAAGAVAGGGHSALTQINIVRRCMSGRGYRVLQ